MEVPSRDRGFDLPALAIGALGTAVLTVGLAAAFVGDVHSAPDFRLTSASLGDGFSFYGGAALGMFAGCAGAARYCRRGSRMATGIVVGFLAWLVGPVPYDLATRPGDMRMGEALGGAIVVGIALALVAIAGALVGQEIGNARDKEDARELIEFEPRDE